MLWAGREDFDVRMLGSGRPFVLEIINARAAVPPQAAFDAMQLTLEKVTSNAASLGLDMQPCTRFVTSLHDAECYMTGLITEHRYSELCHCCTAAVRLDAAAGCVTPQPPGQNQDRHWGSMLHALILLSCVV